MKSLRNPPKKRKLWKKVLAVVVVFILFCLGLAFYGAGPAAAHVITDLRDDCTGVTVKFDRFPSGTHNVTFKVKGAGSEVKSFSGSKGELRFTWVEVGTKPHTGPEYQVSWLADGGGSSGWIKFKDHCLAPTTTTTKPPSTTTTKPPKPSTTTTMAPTTTTKPPSTTVPPTTTTPTTSPPSTASPTTRPGPSSTATPTTAGKSSTNPTPRIAPAPVTPRFTG